MSVKLADKGNVKVSKDGENITVTYHGTVIVSASPENIRLNTGGWFTASTKRHMNQASDEFGLGFRVYQARGEWFAIHNELVKAFNSNTLVLARGN